MRTLLFLLAISLFRLSAFAQQSPNGRLTVTASGRQLTVCYQQQPVLEIETPVRLSQLKKSKPVAIEADYQMVAGKRLHCTNQANEYRIPAKSPNARNACLVMRLYNDGVALRFENKGGEVTALDQFVYRIPEGTQRWMQKWNEAYEGFFPLTTTAEDGRWGYPALVEAAPAWLLITEANIEKGQSASSLYSEGECYRIVPEENTTDHTPWRVVIVGSLADIVESTLVTDVSEPCKIADTSWIHPGVVSWVYWAYNHGSNDYDIIKMYVDLAAELRLPYVLIDAEWDEMKDGKSVEDAVRYACSKGVKPMIWYNSSVGWIDGAPGPKFRLNRPEDREREFAWCEQIGVAGVKIDFFSGDNQLNMDYCQDLLESAARHHLLVNFHGATIPRGWQRTWPNLLSTEGVYGAEWYNNKPTLTSRAASHNATLPFTRNVVGPMDYTPCAFSDSQHPHITTHAHELALIVLFESGLQHLADRPSSLLAQPQTVQDFLGRLPAAWDETRFVCGYPGEYVVLARRSGDTWYVAGINGTDGNRPIYDYDLSFIGSFSSATLFADSGDAEHPWQISTVYSLPTKMLCQPRGGFVFVIKK